MSSTYQHFLLNNATRITSIESTLRSVTWFLPGRFKDAELASESLYTTLNILSLYHDRIITKVVSTLPSSQKPTQSSHTRYTSAWCAVSPTYSFLAHTLAVISRSQLLIEMLAARRLGSKRRWRVVLMLELIKAFLKLKLLDLTSRMLVNPPLPERTIDPAALEAHQSRTCQPSSNVLWSPHSPQTKNSSPNSESNSSSSDLTWIGKRTGIIRPSIAALRSPPNHFQNSGSVTGRGRNSVNDYLSRKALTLEEVLKPLDLVRKSKSAKARLAEIIWILRPVIYVLAINGYGHRHAVPFLCSISIEYLSYSLRRSSLHQFQPRSGNQLTSPLFFADSPRRTRFQNFVSELERNELNQRKKEFWSYFLRGPLWVLWTKPKLIKLANKIDSVPLLNLVSTAIHDYVPLLDEYHYYVS